MYLCYFRITIENNFVVQTKGYFKDDLFLWGTWVAQSVEPLTLDFHWDHDFRVKGHDVRVVRSGD